MKRSSNMVFGAIAIACLILGLWLQVRGMSGVRAFTQQHPLVPITRDMDNNLFPYSMILLTQQKLSNNALSLMLVELIAGLSFVAWFYWLRPHNPRSGFVPIIIILGFITLVLERVFAPISRAYQEFEQNIHKIDRFINITDFSAVQQAQQQRAIGLVLCGFALLLVACAFNLPAIKQWFYDSSRAVLWLRRLAIACAALSIAVYLFACWRLWSSYEVFLQSLPLFQYEITKFQQIHLMLSRFDFPSISSLILFIVLAPYLSVFVHNNQLSKFYRFLLVGIPALGVGIIACLSLSKPLENSHYLFRIDQSILNQYELALYQSYVAYHYTYLLFTILFVVALISMLASKIVKPYDDGRLLQQQSSN